jgi:hypothetical protein
MPAGSVQLEKPQKNRRITYIKMSEQWVTRQIDGASALDIVDETRRLDKVLLFDLEVGLVPEYIAGVLVVLARMKVGRHSQVRWNSRTSVRG